VLISCTAGERSRQIQLVKLGCAIAVGATLLAQSSATSAEEAASTARAAEGAQLPEQTDEPELDVLTFHRANYAVSGFTRDTQVKFQFSFKYDLWPSTGHHTVYLAYTQKSLWDLYDKSSPFRESNYAPEIFYTHYHSEVHGQPNPGCGLFAEQLGIEHESNGEASDASRSWDRIFASIEATCYGKPAYGLLGLRLWYPLGLDENATIAKTQGYGELTFGVGIDHDGAHVNGLVTIALRKGMSKELAKGSMVIDARWRPTYQRLLGKAWKFAPYLWFQMFAGYGETLGTYDSATTGARVGVGFTDRVR
jgi:phospholipase A1